MNKVLIIGNGGREHALAWKFASSPQVSAVYVARGNAGTELESKVTNVPIAPLDIDELIAFAEYASVDLIVVGPAIPLSHGIVDAFLSAGLCCLGPSQQAARLESSKIFAKQFMNHYNIPTALYRAFHASERDAAVQYVKDIGLPAVIKADGLTAGHAAVVATTLDEAITAIDAFFSQRQFGNASPSILIEEYLQGRAVSYTVLTDGETVIPLSTAEGDAGPIQSGMGAVSPADLMNDLLDQHIMVRIIQPTLRALLERGHRYTGFLYVSLMITDKGECKVLEFNCQLGDPEAQSILMRLQSDFFTCCFNAAKQQLQGTSLEWNPGAAVGVVMAAKGYPDVYSKGDKIAGLENVAENEVKVFHCGTRHQDHDIVTDGGRVLCVTALGNNLAAAKTKAYQHVQQIHWPNHYYRNDIGRLL